MKIDKNKVRSFRIGLVVFLSMGSIISAPVRVTTAAPVPSQSGLITLAAQPVPFQPVAQQPVAAPQSVTAQSVGLSQVPYQVSSGPVSDELFLQNTANKLISEKLNGLKVKLERYKKYIVSNANELAPKIKKLFGV